MAQVHRKKTSDLCSQEGNERTIRRTPCLKCLFKLKLSPLTFVSRFSHLRRQKGDMQIAPPLIVPSRIWFKGRRLSVDSELLQKMLLLFQSNPL